MSKQSRSSMARSEVAMWHRLSGYPDNVTDQGDVITAGGPRRQQTEKELLRAAIADLSSAGRPDQVRSLARLAASYLLAGDTETARRYVNGARERLGEGE